MSKLSSVVQRFQSGASLPESALPRPLDLSYASNRTALYGTLAFGAVSLLLRRSGRQALGVSGVAMLAWATGRELDPDDSWSAAAALGLAGAAGLLQTAGKSAPALLPGMAALSATRMLSATVGYAASPQDAAALSAQAGAAALAGYRFPALIPAAALALSDAQDDALVPQAPWSVPAALGAALLPSLRRALPGETPPEKRPSQVVGDLLSLAALAFSRQTLAPEKPSSSCDLVPIPVSASRLQASRALGLGALAVALLRRESATLLPLAAACLGVGLRRTLRPDGHQG